MSAPQKRAFSAAPGPVRYLVGQLQLERYKASIKALTQFGYRRQGTDRKRAALDWIEAQLQSYGCGNVEWVRSIINPPIYTRPTTTMISALA